MTHYDSPASMSPPRRIGDDSALDSGSEASTPSGANQSGSYFRRTSLAIAAARRFTLYENLATSPTSPLHAPALSVTSSTSPVSPRVNVHFNEDNLALPSPIKSTHGSSFGSPFFRTSSGANAPARYGSPLHESDEEAGIESSGDAISTSPGTVRAAAANAACRPMPSRGLTSASHASHVSSRRRSSTMGTKYRWLSGGGRGSNTGDEPGVDVRSERDQEAYGHLKGKTHVTVVDYSCDPEAEDTNVRVDFPGERLAEWLDSSQGKRPLDEDGKPSSVRWIHVSGLNWEIIKTLTLKFQLHPLAVEDALRSGRSPRSKVDYYAKHLYLQILVYHIHAPDRAALAKVAEGIPDGVTIPYDDMGGEHESAAFEHRPQAAQKRKRWWWQKDEGAIQLPEGLDSIFEPSRPNKQHSRKEAHRMVVEKLTAEYMVPIRKGILSVFMMRDGTLISISAHDIHEALAPIYERLEDEHSLLRRFNDVSLLAYALLDVSVDLALEISTAFEDEILKVESKVLVQAHLELVRHLHIIQAQILRFRRQLSSLLHACYVIRDQDGQRSQAAASWTMPRSTRLASDLTSIGLTSAGASAQTTPQATPTGTMSIPPPIPEHSPAPEVFDPHHNIHNGILPSHFQPQAGTTAMGSRRASSAPATTVSSVVGYFSPLTKAYMNDVIDHLETVVNSSEQFVGSCDHLTNYCFNVLSFHTNNSMERLSIVTVVFLPLTFIASYFGMNFTDFPSLEHHDSFFWRVAAPCTITFFLVFSYSYLVSAWETFMRRTTRFRNRGRDVDQEKKRQ